MSDGHGGTASATATVSVSSITYDVSGGMALEGEDLTFTVTADSVLTDDDTLTLRLSGMSATLSDVDQTAMEAQGWSVDGNDLIGSLTMAAGTDTATVKVPVLSDGLSEGVEAFELSVSGGTGNFSGASALGVIGAVYNPGQSVNFGSTGNYLSHAPSATGDLKTWTLSTWIKRDQLNKEQFLFDQSGMNAFLRFESNNTLRLRHYNGSVLVDLITTQTFTNTSDWMNIVVQMDTTESAASDRARIYIDGQEITSFSTAVYPSQNQNMLMGDAGESMVLGNAGTFNHGFSGKMADVHFLDGVSQDASAFGQDDGSGNWIAQGYSGSHGTNGFHMTFDGATIGENSEGADWSGSGSLSVSSDAPTAAAASPLVGTSGADNLSGGDAADVLQGNGGDDSLSGGGGDDIFEGGAGNDTMSGGSGADTYFFRSGDDADTIDNSDTSATPDQDVVRFGTGIGQDDLWFRVVGDDLQISVAGTNDSLTVSAWNTDSANQHLSIEAAGATLDTAGIHNLVSAMSAFTAPGTGQSIDTVDPTNTLDPVIAANWQA